MDEKIPVKEIGQLLDEVSTKIPTLLNGVLGSLYSADAGANMGKAVGSFYKELLDAGIPQEDAMKMAKDYMLSLKDITRDFSSHSGGSGKTRHRVHIVRDDDDGDDD